MAGDEIYTLEDSADEVIVFNVPTDTAGALTLEVTCTNSEDPGDTQSDDGTVNIIKVDSIEATAPEAGASLNPPPFAGHMPWPFDVTKSVVPGTPDKHMVVFHKDVIDSSFDVQDFDVTLTATLLPPSMMANQLRVRGSDTVLTLSLSLHTVNSSELHAIRAILATEQNASN